MKKNFKSWLLFLIAALAISIIAACSSNNAAPADTPEKEAPKEEPKQQEEAKNDEPVTIRWAHQWGEENFEETIGQYVKEKFPNVTIEVQEAGTDNAESLEQLVAAGKSPDIVTMGLMTHVNFLEDLGLAYDMDELIKMQGFDLERFEPSIITFARNQDPHQNNGLYTLPTGRATFSLHYNKDVFDILGVDYPSDEMTWEEVVELAKELTREVNGVQYRGLDLDVPYDAYTQFSQNSIDPDTDEVLITESEAYRRYLEMVKAVTSIPGNYPAEEPGSLLHNWGAAFGEGNVAMAPAKTHFGWLGQDNIDIVSFPVWEGYEGIDPGPNGNGYTITAPSEHKEIALEILDFIYSDEMQKNRSKDGWASPLVNPDIHAVFAENKPEFLEKNLASMFLHEYATGPAKKAKYGDGVLWTAPIEFVNSGKDINEFLRILQEQAEENVRSQKESE
ncbi:ABC transporter substrate-binding protein [Lederbergia wuyishanensis]|uniref:ABC-type glycerol-3-phosphate transport system substrate-binding protein n=1 Tax=Lederbergia wuyishanensis TaxID=1347903 RepID=A0ABU0D9C7_9BACI|nr:extracellular solute-binding protein [Lederbergia wuyishanensis]MCJ8009406.1 extracellular solute-binding protein [Lederbergia wuyishanensis]MDQ0344985.1 ABC-type glycerol-3-phosphate transport system substrate-binding protein [Lederbergia wuyishanensis]